MLKPLQTLAVAFGGWVNCRQLDTIVYLREEVRVLREQLGLLKYYHRAAA